jgi:DNA-binding response OmpR family regulator
VVLLAIADPRERYRAERALSVLRPSVSTTGVSRGPALVISDQLDELEQLRPVYPDALLLAVIAASADASRALDAGADAVVVRGAPVELRARVRALLRREAGAWPDVTAIGALQIDLRTRHVAAGGVTLTLRPREYTLLACLASEPGRVFTKRELVRRCWGEREPPPHSRALETQIVRLRRRLGNHAALLVTVWSVGYVLTEPR